MNSEALNELSKQIKSPVPFWFLNGKIDRWHIEKEFEMMQEKGVSEVIVHPRYGLEVEYLSDDWFEIFGWCLQEAKKRKMHVWIYDELNWPSGTAGMQVMKINENYQGKYLAVDIIKASDIDKESFVLGLYTIEANIDVRKVVSTKIIKSIDEIDLQTNDSYIFNCTKKFDRFYIDTLNFDAVNCFKQLTYEEYYKRFSDDFGKTIRAIFTDEPSIYWVSVGYDDYNLPYTDDFFQTFEEKYGYSPIEKIPLLFYPGKGSASLRADFWEHAGFLFNERYHNNLGNWCREHNIIYTGHNNHEDPLRYQIRFQGNMFDTMRAMDIPGVDHLGKATLGNTFINIIGHKICSSHTHTSGKARCMSESFGIMNWDTTFYHLKKVVDWQFGLGINLLIPHAIYHTISGIAKRESPPSFFYQSPHWNDFDYFSKYLSRLEEMLCDGRHVCKVAVLYPFNGLWSSYQPDKKTEEFTFIENFLNSLCLQMIKSQVDFDLIDFIDLMSAKLEDNKIKLADEEYEILLVPAVPYMREIKFKRLSEVVNSGVQTSIFHKSMEPDNNNIPATLKKADFIRTEEMIGYVENLKKEIDYGIQLTGNGSDDILAYRRSKDGRKITFLVNRSDKHRKVSATINDMPNACIFDPETGIYTKLDTRPAGTKEIAQLEFEAGQSYFVVSNVPDVKHKTYFDNPKQINIISEKVELPYNVASLYHFKYHSDSDIQDVDVRINPKFEPVNWDPNPPDFTQYAGVYEAKVNIETMHDNVKLMLDANYKDCKVFVNDTEVELVDTCKGINNCDFLTDFLDVECEISHLLKNGENILRVECPYKLSEPIRLVGNFHIKLEDNNVIIMEMLSVDPYNLSEYYPFFSGTVTYNFECIIDKQYDKVEIELPDVNDSIELLVNGKIVGKRLWPPYKLDVTEFAIEGLNNIRVDVRNNMVNMLFGEPRPFGLLKKPIITGYSKAE
ncbi:MAG: glycosyl hydrolase [Armatimonadota bacterium]